MLYWFVPEHQGVVVVFTQLQPPTPPTFRGKLNCYMQKD